MIRNYIMICWVFCACMLYFEEDFQGLTLKETVATIAAAPVIFPVAAHKMIFGDDNEK